MKERVSADYVVTELDGKTCMTPSIKLLGVAMVTPPKYMKLCSYVVRSDTLEVVYFLI